MLHTAYCVAAMITRIYVLDSYLSREVIIIFYRLSCFPILAFFSLLPSFLSLFHFASSVVYTPPLASVRATPPASPSFLIFPSLVCTLDLTIHAHALIHL